MNPYAKLVIHLVFQFRYDDSVPQFWGRNNVYIQMMWRGKLKRRRAERMRHYRWVRVVNRPGRNRPVIPESGDVKSHHGRIRHEGAKIGGMRQMNVCMLG